MNKMLFDSSTQLGQFCLQDEYTRVACKNAHIKADYLLTTFNENSVVDHTLWQFKDTVGEQSTRIRMATSAFFNFMDAKHWMPHVEEIRPERKDRTLMHTMENLADLDLLSAESCAVAIRENVRSFRTLYTELLEPNLTHALQTQYDLCVGEPEHATAELRYPQHIESLYQEALQSLRRARLDLFASIIDPRRKKEGARICRPMLPINIERTAEQPESHFRKFALADMGIDDDVRIELDAACNDLQWDMYDVRRTQKELLKTSFPNQSANVETQFPDFYSGLTTLEDFVRNAVSEPSPFLMEQLRHCQPFRKRAVSEFAVEYHDSAWHVRRVANKPYVQTNVGAYDRSLPRTYPEAPSAIADHPAITSILKQLASMIKNLRPEANSMTISIHPTSVIAKGSTAALPSLEGMHNDGADYIVSALVLSRNSVLGGESIVYGKNQKDVYLRTILEPGEGIFQDDAHLMHDVTPIHKDPHCPDEYAVRNMIGFDVIIRR